MKSISTKEKIKFIRKHWGGFGFAHRLKSKGINIEKISKQLRADKISVDELITKYAYLW